jgi:hypothetical protein
VRLTNCKHQAAAVSLRMKHVALRLHDDVSHHLSGFCILELKVFLLTHRLSEFLRNDLTHFAPDGSCIHGKKIISFIDEIMQYVGRWSVAVFGASLIHELSDDPTVGKHDGRASAKFE